MVDQHRAGAFVVVSFVLAAISFGVDWAARHVGIPSIAALLKGISSVLYVLSVPGLLFSWFYFPGASKVIIGGEGKKSP